MSPFMETVNGEDININTVLIQDNSPVHTIKIVRRTSLTNNPTS